MWHGHDAIHSPPYIAKVRNAWTYTFTPSHTFEAQCLTEHMENLTSTRHYTRIIVNKIMNWKLNRKGLIPGIQGGIFSLTTKALGAIQSHIQQFSLSLSLPPSLSLSHMK
jgi:hypothetical protein